MDETEQPKPITKDAAWGIKLTMGEAARAVLKDAGPMHQDDIYDEVVRRGYLKTVLVPLLHEEKDIFLEVNSDTFDLVDMEDQEDVGILTGDE